MHAQKTDKQDTSLDVVEAIGQLDLKSFCLVQLRRLYTATMQVATDVDVELKVRSENPLKGDTVRFPVPSITKLEF